MEKFSIRIFRSGNNRFFKVERKCRRGFDGCVLFSFFKIGINDWMWLLVMYVIVIIRKIKVN